MKPVELIVEYRNENDEVTYAVLFRGVRSYGSFYLMRKSGGIYGDLPEAIRVSVADVREFKKHKRRENCRTEACKKHFKDFYIAVSETVGCNDPRIEKIPVWRYDSVLYEGEKPSWFKPMKVAANT